MEAARVAGKPAVGRRRSEVELGAEPVQRLSRRGDPFGVGMARVELCLLGVGAIAGRDDQPGPVSARGRRKPVERPRHVRAHRLALPVGERPVVAAAGRLERSAFAQRRHDLRHGDCLDGDRIATHGHLPAHHHLHARGGKLVPAGKGHVGRLEACPVCPADRERRGPRPRQVVRLAQVIRVRATVDRRRLEQPLEVVLHRPRGGQCREVGSALRAALAGQSAAEREQHRSAQHQREQRTQRDDQRLAALRLRPFRMRRAHPCRTGSYADGCEASARCS